MSEYFEQVEHELCAAVRRRAHVPGRRRAALSQAAELPHRLTASLQEIDRRLHRPRLRAAMGLAAAGAVAATVITFAGLGGGTQRAFAGWTSAPTAPASGQTQEAEAACREKLRDGTGVAAGRQSTKFTGWQETVADVRGPYTMLALESADGTARARCLFKPSSGAEVYFYGQGLTPIEPASVPAGQVQVAESWGTGEGRPEHEERSSEMLGATGSEVTGVTLLLSDGTRVTASTGHGQFLAWWPGWQKAVSVEVQTASGTHIQQLPKIASIG